MHNKDSEQMLQGQLQHSYECTATAMSVTKNIVVCLILMSQSGL